MKEEIIGKIFRNSLYSGILYLVATIGVYYYILDSSYNLEQLFDSKFDNIFELFVIITISLFSTSILSYGIKTYYYKRDKDKY